jgi:mannose/cellobiose epimerase-like protein (N-acyl-D-glucosamine 2-epimerase family)
MFTQVDVSAGSCNPISTGTPIEHSELLRDVLAAQDRTNEILEELVCIMGTQQKQRAQELHQWRNANPQLAEACRGAAEALSRVQVEYLDRITEEINDTADDLADGEFMLNEFVDRFGPRLAHLNGMIQVLAQLSSTPTPANQADPA